MGDKVEFNESKARLAETAWNAVGTEAAEIATAANAITDTPWGDGEFGKTFGPGFNPNREAVQKNGDGLATYLKSFGSQIGDAADLLSRQSSNRSPES